MSSSLRVLIVEDSPDDAELVRLELERAGFELEWDRVETEPAFLEALEGQDWDLIISDFRMPGFNGLRAFALFRESGLDIPFIFVSGELGEERAVEAMRAGARDYLLKGNLARLHVAVRRELEEAANRRQQRATREQVRRERLRLATAVEASGAGVFEYRVPADATAYHSPRWTEILGYEEDELPGGASFPDWAFSHVHPDDLAMVKKARRDFVEGRSAKYQVEIRMRHKQGHWVDVAVLANAAERDAAGRAVHVVGVMLDLTEPKHLESQLREAQKMEAVGRLAGGVAHDFNNLLTVIFSFGSFVLEQLRPGEPVYRDIEEILKAAQRAESLTGQLLAFSRHKTVAPRVVGLNQVISEIDRMIRRLLGADIDFRTQLSEDLWNVRIDPDVFEQVLVNLAINARDAMPEGGKLTIESQNAQLDESYHQIHGTDIPAGEYVVVSLSDTGSGMDAATQARIFEPFFTTKEPGKGTGLGLSTCYGIVRQAGGYIWVYSELGKGTTFKIYLPRCAAEASVDVEAPPAATLHGSETILVAEDNEQVRQLIVRALARYGYRVMEAADGEQAMRRCATSRQPIDLLLTDLVMPGLSGKELAERVVATRPDIRVLFTSGYSANAIAHRGELAPGAQMLHKPFTPDALVRRVREALDAST
jgi:PAS domain S-box-containing protein